ncbi:polyphosphate polymerase domain-containing protein [uncultured Senegalimassilia sp.]|uniref:polyphosphate polymerase domain-containing protein n=1 Tax=uncultured Senegalimassilia sp. TaxID=1714350 RepID=UPI0025F84381|nr:polyphosphate polymerase domain-containing protein [uncultured Senegalimassilia sp.]
MASFTDTFERKEVKYRLNAKQHREVLDALAGRMAADEFGRTRITSLYFDTPTRDLIARSLEKPLYKEKLRVRWYGTPTSGERVYVEIKKKYDGIVYKRRVGCSLTAAYAYLMGRVPYENACVQNPLADQLQQDEALTLHSIQIAREIDAFTARYRNLRPSMYIVCERTAYAPVPGADADGLRITFDSGVAYRDVLAGEREAGSAFHPLLGLGETIMEVKTSGSYPSWLVEVLSGCQAYPSSFSKYGAAYQECERAASVVRLLRRGASQAEGAVGREPLPATAPARAGYAMRRGAAAPVASPAVSASKACGAAASPQRSSAQTSSQETAVIDRLSSERDSRARRVSAPAAGSRVRRAVGASSVRNAFPSLTSRKDDRCA